MANGDIWVAVLGVAGEDIWRMGIFVQRVRRVWGRASQHDGSRVRAFGEAVHSWLVEVFWWLIGGVLLSVVDLWAAVLGMAIFLWGL